MSVEFVDTNILGYAYDEVAPEKHRRARELMDRLWTERSGVISTQVLQEFFVTVTAKIRFPLKPKAARAIIQDLIQWRVVTIGPEDVLAAIDAADSHQISLWDSLIIVAATAADASIVWTEDLNDGQKFGSVTVRNPFK